MDDAHDLSIYRWKNRLLLVFSPKDSNAYQRQLSLLEQQKEGLRDRDLLVLRLLENEHDADDASAREAKDLRERFEVQEGAFVVILIGKDGSEKQRFHEPVEMHEVFAIIDSMPMRQQELRSQD